MLPGKISVMKRLKEIFKQLLVLLLAGEMCTFALPPLYAADITVDTSAANKPTLDTAQNGVTVVNLATANSNGVSHNMFQNYNVGTGGVILNNSVNMGVSVLGGAMYGNPNYQSSGVAASLVINEVTGSGRSSLLGATEMFGKSAEFVLVNPNGIMCNGASFINMPRVTLATGRAVFDSDVFKGIDISGGSLIVEGKGIDAGQVNYFEIVSRVASLNGGIWGKDVSINTGTGFYNYNDKTFTQKDTGEPKPEIGIDASALGSIYAGRITVVSNEKGVGVKSDGDMVADVSDIKISADGNIELKNAQSAKNVTVTSISGDIKQNGNTFAMENAGYSAKNITNRGSIKALKDISLAGLIDNNGGKIASSGNIDIAATGTLDNNGGSITTAGENGTISIHGNGSLDILGGEIKSAGNIGIDMTGNVTLNSGISSIYAEKHLGISSADFTNNINLSMNGAIGINASGNIVNSSGSSIVSKQGVSISSGGNIVNSGIISNASDMAINGKNISNYKEISSGNDLSIHADTILNSGALIFSGNKMTIETGSLKNTKSGLNESYIYSMGDMTITGTAPTGNSIYNYSSNIESEKNMSINLGADGRLENTGEDTYGYTTTFVHVGDYGDECWAVMDQYVLSQSLMHTDYSTIKAGGNLDITSGEVKNHGSVISAGADITINAATLINETNNRNEYVAQLNYMGHKHHWTKKFCHWGWTEYDEGDDYSEVWEAGYINVVSNDKAIISAGGKVTLTGGAVNNGFVEENKPGVVLSGNTVDKAYEAIANNGAIDLSQNININNDGNALFTVNSAPGSTYLIETRNEYIDVEKLKGSQYLLTRIGFNPEKDVKFLGDAFYEQKLVTESILKATSNRYLDESIKSDQEQMTWLLDNAASAYRDLELAVGVELSKDQINRLQQPIIWYVEDEVMGQKVLVPKIYIPEHIIEGFSKNSSSTIAGNSVNINADGNVGNAGRIEGKSSVEITANGNITNSGGTIKSGGSLTLTAVNGNIINETEVSTAVYNPDYVNTTVGAAASIEAGGKLTVNAGGNFTNRGAEVKSGGDAVIEAGGNINFETIKINNTVYKEADDTSGISTTSESAGSTLASGGNLVLASGRDINFVGSKADITGSADITTAGNFNLLNDYDTSSYHGTKKENKTFSSETTTVDMSTKTVVSSGFTTGGNLKVKSGNDINIVGSDIKSGGDAELDAEGTERIIAVHDESYYSRTTEKTGFATGGALYGSEKKSDMVSDKTVSGSAIDIAGQYASKSGKDTDITGSTLNIGGEADITTGGSLNVRAAYNEHAEEHKTEKSGVLTTDGDLYAKSIDAAGNGATTAAGSAITAGKLKASTGGDFLMEGSAINAGIAEFDTTGSFTETSAKETSYEYSIHEKTTMGINMDLFTNPKNAFDYDQGRASVTLAGGSYDSVKERTDRETQSSSKLNVSEDLTVNSGKNITVAGSEINTGGDVTLTAAENVSIKTTEEKTSHTAEETHGSVEFSFGGKNAATDVAYATKALVEAKEAVVKAKNDYEKYRESLKKAEDDHKNNLIDQDDLDSIREQEAFYIANIALCGENVVAKTAALLQSAAGAAGSAEAFGFSGDAQFEIDATKTKSTSESTTAKASTIKTGGSFTVTAGSKAEVKGSSVAAGEDITLDAENVEISAAENRESSSEDKKHANMKVSFGTSGAIGVNASADSTETDSESKTYTNAHLSGNNIKIKSSEDTTVIGGVVKAKNELDLDVNGSLVVQSLQDKSKNSSQTIGASGGVSVTGENVSGNAGVNANFSTGKKSWVTEQTSLTGGTVNVDVEDKTTLRGAVIASTTDNLTLTTGSLEFSNIKDKDVSFNAGGSASGSFKPTENTYSSSLNYGYTDNRQTNLATIGAGTITITKPETSAEGLNRDVTISQYNTYSGGLKGGVTVDTATVELIKDREKTLYNTVDALESGLTEAEKTAKKVDQEIETTIEKTENLLKFDHYTEDKNVSSYQTMDEYEKKVENGKPVSAQEKLDYYELKKAVGEKLSPEEQQDENKAIQTRTKEVANDLKQDILDTYTKDGALVINAKIALLEKLDPDAAHAIKVRFAEERAEIAYAKQLAVNSGLRDAEIQQGNEIAKETKMFANEGVSAQGICGGVDDVLFGAVIGANTLATGKNQYGEEATDTEKGFAAAAIILPIIPIGGTGKVVENIGEEAFEHGDDIANAAGKIVEKVQTLYRAVGPNELADIQSSGVLRNLGSAEGKYFSTYAEDAASYAKQAVNGFGDAPYTLIKTDVPKTIFEGLTPAIVDRGISAWVIPDERLEKLVPTVLDYMPLTSR